MHHQQCSFGSHAWNLERGAIAFLAAVVCMVAAGLQAASPRVVITPASGFTITWDGNNGGFNNPNAGAGPSNNVALASNGTTPFTSSDLGPLLSIPFHRAINLNDGLYGNSYSWISANGVGGTSDPDPFAGLRFSASVNVSAIAWSRDNGDATEGGCAGGTCVDRTVGTYTLQFTTVAGADATTPETGNASTGWRNIGTVQYLPGAESATFTSYLRHRFDMRQGGAAIAATALRVKVSSGLTAIDEIEVNPIPDPIPPITTFIDITPASGFSIAWDRNEGLYSNPSSPAPAPVNDASVSRGATAFGSSQLDFGVHFIPNVNDGLYGNAHSWIPDFSAAPDPNPFIGINFGRRLLLRDIAWGRDNGDAVDNCCGGTLTDRTLGVYEIQVTSAPNPGLNTLEACGPNPDSGWVTIGTINYKANDLTYFNSYLRHRFDVARNGAPIAATGIRIKVPNNQIDIDEIEVNGNLAIESQAIRITNAPGATITWDGNDGHFNNPAAGAAPPANSALASQGTAPFTSSDLGPGLGIPFHRAVNLNDGLYGNNNSWISANGIGGNSDPDPFAGLSFGSSVSVTNIAWGRDNGNNVNDCCGGIATDRALDTYRLQYTSVAAPDASTPDTGDAATGWQDVGTVVYASAAPPFFTPYLRHRFDLSAGGAPLDATGIRIKVANGATAIDEIEVNTSVSAPPPPAALAITPAPGYNITWDGNDGQFNEAAAVAPPPGNPALAIMGTTAFGSSQLDFGVHFIRNVNDGRYGNANSWIPDFAGAPDPNPFIGLNFGGIISLRNIAWSRDNGNATEGGCAAGTCTDRALGAYTLQFTTVDNPDAGTPETGDASTGWELLGVIDYRRADPPDFNPHLRHRFDVSVLGGPVDVSGIRIKVPNNQIDIDEIEVNTATSVPPPQLSVQRSGNELTVTWLGGGGLEWAPTVLGPWNCIDDAVSPHPVTIGADGPVQFFRVRR